MSVRSARLSLALLVAAPVVVAPLSAQGVEYAAGTTKYRISTTTKGTQSSPINWMSRTTTSKPLVARLPAIPSPMFPSPTNPTRHLVPTSRPLDGRWPRLT